jgi:hypothetical protein
MNSFGVAVLVTFNQARPSECCGGEGGENEKKKKKS